MAPSSIALQPQPPIVTRSFRPDANLLAMLTTLNASLPAEAWHISSRVPSRPLSSAISLLQSAVPLPPTLCCKCDSRLSRDTLSPHHCCPCMPNSCPCDAFSDSSTVSMSCRRSLQTRNCFALDGRRVCVCPKWQTVPSDSFELVAENAVTLGPDWYQVDDDGRQWPILKQTTTGMQCAAACLLQPGCTSYLSYIDSTCALFQMRWFPWRWEVAGGSMYLRRATDPTELFGAGECRCRGGKMNRYHFPHVQSEQACVQYCTASLGCLGVQTVAKRFLWATEVPNYPQLRVQGYNYGCNIMTTHRSSMVMPERGQAAWLPGDDILCNSIDTLNFKTQEGQSSECRLAKRDALQG